MTPRTPVLLCAGSDVVFTCSAQGASDIHWYFNGTLQGSDGTQFNRFVGVGVFRTNRILLGYNKTSVRCEAVFSNTKMRSAVSHILVQGE